MNILTTLAKAQHWVAENYLLFALAWPAVTGVINWIWKPRSPEQYAAYGRLGGVLKFVASSGFDPRGSLEGVKRALTKKVPASQLAATIPPKDEPAADEDKQ